MLGSPNRPIRHIFEFSCLRLLAEIAAKICNLFTFSCKPWEYITPKILNERRARLTDCRTRKKQFREFLTAVKGTFC